MTITRHQITVRDDGTPYPGAPIISQIVTRGDTVYLCGVVSGWPPTGDVTYQTKKVLARIDELLAEAGTDKSKLLTAQVWLSDMGLFAEHNDAWNEWVDHANPPVRACVEARLTHEGLLVEIMVTAAP